MQQVAPDALPQVKNVIAVGAGKGGVGKSTLAVNLAIALKRLGKRVGMVDADIYGPSLPRLLASEGVKPEAQGKRLIPVPNALGIPMLSMGHLANPGQAIAWRGPMVSSALGGHGDAHIGHAGMILASLGDARLQRVARGRVQPAHVEHQREDISLHAHAAGTALRQRADPLGQRCVDCPSVRHKPGSRAFRARAQSIVGWIL
jgi:ATP-binding protein involved in chromosome partitioning